MWRDIGYLPEYPQIWPTPREFPKNHHYFDHLQSAGCRRLLTNARWRSGVEMVDLTAPRLPFEQVREGWYACRCGAVGYVGQGERSDAPAVEVSDCPACQSREKPGF